MAKERRRRSARRNPFGRLIGALRVPGRGFGVALTLTLLAGVSLYGAVRGGEYEAFVAQEGSPADFLARQFGFGIDAITISGQMELTEKEILQGAGVSERTSLLLLNPAQVREHLLAIPLVKEATVTKLYPNRLSIAVVERNAYALWQKDGVISVIAADGAAIDTRKDSRFDNLPLVVGDEANEHIQEFVSLLDAAGDLRAKIRAGTFITDRRWNLTMTSGVIVKLPEDDPASAITQLAKLEREQHVLDRDIITLDMRVPGRMIARLSEEAFAARADMLDHNKAKSRGRPVL
ncbi:cell division protein FtsQ/DivIB [Methylovirgula sp. 4M-Z18]|uniref:cell division protein FtsQ/DivIB n=1 Tax=Methylovirgula sp. 4M-Z18 TaxID=2293567 RepID=UPI001FDFF274|nr:FtsQ-type POTRA domain-containing protein [Methylovirgula sp. 4M-Z18]